MVRAAGFEQAKYRNLTMGIAACIRAGSSSMRGPHNIWRLIRTGATLERTGAMGVVLDAFDAPPLLAHRCRAFWAGRSNGWATRAIRRCRPPPAR